MGIVTRSPALASMSGRPGEWKRTVPVLMKKPSSCISWRWKTGPTVRGGRSDSIAARRIWVVEPSSITR